MGRKHNQRMLLVVYEIRKHLTKSKHTIHSVTNDITAYCFNIKFFFSFFF